MTSRISYSKLSKENRKRNLGVILITILAFFIKAVLFVMMMKECEAYEDIISNMRPNMLMAGVVIGLAVVSAAGSMYYLHSKSQTDFYESLPIKRTTLFKISALNSLLVFLIPLIIEEAVEFVVAGQQILGGSVFAVVSSVLWYLLVFAASWLTMALAMIMTGNIIVGVLGFGVFASYFPIVLYNIFPLYANSFFSTYSGKTADSIYNSITNCLSPVWIGLRGMAYINTSTHIQIKYMAVLLLWIIGLYVLCQVLYNKRMAESAGRAMAFPKANTIIKVLLVIPSALYSGIIFYSFGSENSIYWLIFGVVFGVIVVHALIECIYQFDVRAMFTHKKQMVFIMACSLFIMVSFSADLFGYDRYVPKESSLEDIVIQPTDGNSYSYWGKGQTGLKGDAMKMALSMIKESVEVKHNTNESADASSGESSTYYKKTGNLFFMSSVSKQEVYSNDIQISVTFNPKNGQKVCRNYTLRSEKARKLYSQLYATREFKQDMYSLYSGNYNKIEEIYWSGIDSRYLNLTKDEKKQFLDTYLSELDGLSYDEVKSTVPIGRFDLSSKGATENMTEVFDSYYIYPSFKKTIAFLKEKGCNADETIADLNIISLDITVDKEGDGQNTQYTINDKKVIDQVKGKLVLQEMLYAPGVVAPDGEFIDIEVNYKDDNGINSVSCQTDSETEKKLSKF